MRFLDAQARNFNNIGILTNLVVRMGERGTTQIGSTMFLVGTSLNKNK